MEKELKTQRRARTNMTKNVNKYSLHKRVWEELWAGGGGGGVTSNDIMYKQQDIFGHISSRYSEYHRLYLYKKVVKNKHLYS